jgi:hydrogenase maturation protease
MPKACRRKALILGVGNILLKDEGLGVRAVEFLMAVYGEPKGVRFLDGGTAGVSILPHLKGYTHIIILDAVSSGGPPGTVVTVRPSGARRAPPSGASAHRIGVHELISLAVFEGSTALFVVIGVVPKDTSPGLELSPEIERSLPRVAEAVMAELLAIGMDVGRRDA